MLSRSLNFYAPVNSDLPAQWEECFGYRPLLAETFTDPDSHADDLDVGMTWLKKRNFRL